MSGLSRQHETDLKVWTDKIIELTATDVAIIDDPDEDLARKAFRATLIAIRNNCMLIEDYIERQSERR